MIHRITHYFFFTKCTFIQNKKDFVFPGIPQNAEWPGSSTQLLSIYVNINSWIHSCIVWMTIILWLHHRYQGFSSIQTHIIPRKCKNKKKLKSSSPFSDFWEFIDETLKHYLYVALEQHSWHGNWYFMLGQWNNKEFSQLNIENSDLVSEWGDITRFLLWPCHNENPWPWNMRSVIHNGWRSWPYMTASFTHPCPGPYTI
jgi:hypothetical protein